jgi:acyl dehydratase
MLKIENMEQWNNAIADWAESYNKNIGRVTKIGVGFYPPKQEGLVIDETGFMNTLVTEDLIRHYADATGDTNPLWRSQEYGRTTRYGGIIAPPRFLDFICPTYGGVPIPFSDIPGMVPLNGGNSVTWYKIVRPGDKFSVIDQFTGCKEVTKPEKPIPRLFNLTSLRTYYNQCDEVVAESRGNIICIFNYIDPSKKDDKAAKNKFADFKRHEFTDEELAEIKYNYDHEFHRGRDVLYWEDVNEGSELPTLAKGPTTVEDSLCFFGGVGYYNAYKVKDLWLDANPKLKFLDPETRGSCPPSLIHISDVHARLQGMPYAISFAAQTEGNICHMICNWMGDDGFLKYLYCKSRRINILGDMNWIKGKVERKYINDEGEHLVDLKVWAENQDHIVHMPGDATVRLLSREI